MRVMNKYNTHKHVLFNKRINDDLLGIKLSLPTINEQKKVASILRTIDTRIELNRRINDNLKATAA